MHTVVKIVTLVHMLRQAQTRGLHNFSPEFPTELARASNMLTRVDWARLRQAAVLTSRSSLVHTFRIDPRQLLWRPCWIRRVKLMAFFDWHPFIQYQLRKVRLMNGSSTDNKQVRQRVYQCSKVKKLDYKPKVRSLANEFGMDAEELDETSIRNQAKEQEQEPSTSQPNNEEEY